MGDFFVGCMMFVLVNEYVDTYVFVGIVSSGGVRGYIQRFVR